MKRFLTAIAVTLIAGLSFVACDGEQACPSDSQYRDGRCRLAPAGSLSDDLFEWPPSDTRGELGQPTPYGPPTDDAVTTDDAPEPADDAQATDAEADAGDAASADGDA